MPPSSPPKESPDFGDEAFSDLLAPQEQPPSEASTAPVLPPEQAQIGMESARSPGGVQTEPSEDLAAAWGAALDDDEILETTPTSTTFDPSSIFGQDDEDGFLEDEISAPALTTSNVPQPPAPAPPRIPQRSFSTDQYLPRRAQQPAKLSTLATVPLQESDNNHGRSAGTPSTGLFDVFYQSDVVPPPGHQQQAPLPRPPIQQARSFADQAKGGYQSPYDLPMEVVKPKRKLPPLARQNVQQQNVQQAPPPPPPPRSNSFSAATPTGVFVAHARRPSSAGRSRPKVPVLSHRRQFSRELTYAPPEDGRAQDPLERWKGCSTFRWNANGNILTSFPQLTPFSTVGSSLPSIRCTAGAIKIDNASTVMPMDERDAKFPGPLTARSKSKKKALLTWMGNKIESLERHTEGVMLDSTESADFKRQVDEKLTLWKISRVFLEHDGALEGSPKIEEEVRKILMPNLTQIGQALSLQTSVPTSPTAGENVDRQVLYQLRQALFEGQRERAIWIAEEKKLWGHAMLIASTMGPEIWKQIVQAFVRSQVKTLGSDARSMAAAYQIFAGNAEECVDELVPPSARAGFQMISKDDGSVNNNALDGLDSWRETLALVASNRTPNDGPSLVALGKLLSSYGRVHAAHMCFLFSRHLAKHSGPDDVNAHFVLLGAGHQNSASTLGSDLDSIILTEIYEYATSLSAPRNSEPYIPQLQSFKLVHAQELAAYGLRTKAQAYCDHITSAYTSTTRPSPYYHPTFTQAVADLGAYLSQTPQDGKGGFFSKPAMNKVSSSASSWFTKFVAGDDDAESNASGAGGAPSVGEMPGPFGMVNSGSPVVSRPASSADIYNPALGGSVPSISSATPSLLQQASTGPSPVPTKYAPGTTSSKYAPGRSYAGSGMPAAEPQRPQSSRYAPTPTGSLSVPRTSIGSSVHSDYGIPYLPSSRRGSAQDLILQGGNFRANSLATDDTCSPTYSPPLLSPPILQPSDSQRLRDSAGSFHRASSGNLTDPSQSAVSSDGYQPPSPGRYEAPTHSYQPYEPEPSSPEDAKPKPKPKMFGDDDEDNDFQQRTASLKKSKADQEAEDAFRKAAEADAARENQKKSGPGGSGWLSGLFGKKDPNAAPGPIRAKLGEQNSFYYDEQLKKWVNKKAGPEDATSSAAATPPPPKGPATRSASAAPPQSTSAPPSRVASGAGLALGPPSRAGTPASIHSNAGEGSGALGPRGLVAPLLPPSRPATSLSNASSIDDLMAAGGSGGTGRKVGGTLKGKKKGRYVDVMAK